uniref:Uncharacterized protein n=1 Tax=Anguilla anguilla TaxID=7936 RepID=A0A0E9RAB8_ANGAN
MSKKYVFVPNIMGSTVCVCVYIHMYVCVD